MRTLLNLIWLVFGGFWLFLEYVAVGLLSIVFIVTIPASVACLRIAFFVLWPFGKVVVPKPGAGAGSALMNLIWFLLPGWLLALGHLITAVLQTITIIGIPLAVANLKLIPITCFPFGKDVMSRREAERRRVTILATAPTR